MDALTTIETNRLSTCEAVIERGLKTFYEVGAALAEIRDARLYRQSHGTFEDYCRERWGMTRRRANQLIEATSIYDTIGDLGTMVPTSERQIRPLAGLTPTEQAEVWQIAVDTAPNGRLTAAHASLSQLAPLTDVLNAGKKEAA